MGPWSSRMYHYARRHQIVHAFSLSLHPQRKGFLKNVAMCKSGRGLSPGTQPYWTLIWDFQPLELQEIHFCHLSHPTCCILLQQPLQTNAVIQRRSEKPRSFPSSVDHSWAVGSCVITYHLCTSVCSPLGVCVCVRACVFFIKKKFFLATPCGLQDLSFPTRDRTCALGSESMES